MCSAGAEIAAIVIEDLETLRALKAPVVRVCGLPIPVPYSPGLEDATLPSRQRIRDAVSRVMNESV
jgi:pyruvate/2-oxoglutarate/acetoin dehydrogenase E1 component